MHIYRIVHITSEIYPIHKTDYPINLFYGMWFNMEIHENCHQLNDHRTYIWSMSFIIFSMNRETDLRIKSKEFRASCIHGTVFNFVDLCLKWLLFISTENKLSMYFHILELFYESKRLIFSLRILNSPQNNTAPS